MNVSRETPLLKDKQEKSFILTFYWHTLLSVSYVHTGTVRIASQLPHYDVLHWLWDQPGTLYVRSRTNNVLMFSRSSPTMNTLGQQKNNQNTYVSEQRYIINVEVFLGVDVPCTRTSSHIYLHTECIVCKYVCMYSITDLTQHFESVIHWYT